MGLGLTHINVIPHFQYFKTLVFSDGTNMLQDILLPDSKKSPLLALPDRSYVIKKGNKIEIFGEAYLLSNGKLQQICSNNKTITIQEEKV